MNDDLHDDLPEQFPEQFPSETPNQTMSEPEVIEALPDEEQVMAYTHHYRSRIVRTIVRKGIPEDPEQQRLLLTTLKDMDVQSLSRKKIKSDERTNAGLAGQTKALIAQILMNTSHHSANRLPDEHRHNPQLTDSTPPPSLVEGETATVTPHQTYDSFVAKYPRMTNTDSNPED